MTDDAPNPRTTQQIDENLRRVFKTMENNEVPDRFTNLLDQLRAKEAGSRSPEETP